MTTTNTITITITITSIIITSGLVAGLLGGALLGARRQNLGCLWIVASVCDEEIELETRSRATDLMCGGSLARRTLDFDNWSMSCRSVV